jgi:NAD(P)-dependent dehydrogenase (short-subunit alcohol dehydrogenase family)
MEPRTVLVTGAARRIGRAIALDFGKRGWRVGVHHSGRASRAEAEAVVGEIKAAGGHAMAFAAELSASSEIARLMPDCVAGLGAPHCLINNAALYLEDDIKTLDPERWNLQLAVNLSAPVLLSKAFADHLPEGVSGNIVSIIDQRVWRPTPLFLSYSVAKAGLWAATQMLAQALAPRIRVNAVGPGPVLRSIHQSQEQFQRQAGATLLGHGTTPEEIALAIRFILDAPAMTGQMIALDGGQHLAWATPDVIDAEGAGDGPECRPNSP